MRNFILATFASLMFAGLAHADDSAYYYDLPVGSTFTFKVPAQTLDANTSSLQLIKTDIMTCVLFMSTLHEDHTIPDSTITLTSNHLLAEGGTDGGTVIPGEIKLNGTVDKDPNRSVVCSYSAFLYIGQEKAEMTKGGGTLVTPDATPLNLSK